MHSVLDGNPRQLVDRLRNTPNVVVLGTATFWEGVDVVGPALSLLVITKLPFAVPTIRFSPREASSSTSRSFNTRSRRLY